MLQPLYLDGTERPVAVLREGPALRLRREGAADVFMPLPRLARVVVHGTRVQWRTEALTACAQAGVPVIFLGPRGVALAICLPLALPAQRQGLAAILEMAASRTDLAAWLENLLRSWERQAIRALLAKARLPVRDLRPRLVHAACLARVAGGGDRGEELHAGLHGLCLSLVLEALARQGVGARFLLACTGGFDLAGRLATVLGWTLWPALWCLAAYLDRYPAKHATATALRRRTVRAFEAETPRLEKALVALLNRFTAELAADGP